MARRAGASSGAWVFEDGSLGGLLVVACVGVVDGGRDDWWFGVLVGRCIRTFERELVDIPYKPGVHSWS